MEALQAIVNDLREQKGDAPIVLAPQLKLREDLGLDSLDLAELTVKLEKESGIDIFEDGLVNTVGEILSKIAG